MLFQNKENLIPSMCSTPIVNKKSRTKNTFGRTPLTPLDINVKIKRSNPAEVEVLKTYIEDLHTSYQAQLKEEKSFQEEGNSDKNECELKGLSERTQIAILQKKLLRSNSERDMNAASVRKFKLELENLSTEHEKLRQEMSRMEREFAVLRESKICIGETCVSRETLHSERQNYEILSNSHKEMELQLCHLSSNLDRQNAKVAQLSEEKRDLENSLSDANKRCNMFKNQITKLDAELESTKKSSSDAELLRQEFEEVKLNKSKIRMEMEFLMDERDTREVTLEEMYKQLTETRKEMAALKVTDEDLQEKYVQLVAESEAIATQYTTCKEVVADTTEMCDYLRSHLTPLLPTLCNKHNVEYTEYTVNPSCPPLIGSVLFVIHAVQILEDLAGSVSINKETRRQLMSVKEDKAALERTVEELRSSLSAQTKRSEERRTNIKTLTETVIQYREQIQSQEECLEFYRDKMTDAASTNEALRSENERHSNQVTKHEEELTRCKEQLHLYDEVLHEVKSRMLSLGSSLPGSLKTVLRQLV